MAHAPGGSGDLDGTLPTSRPRCSLSQHHLRPLSPSIPLSTTHLTQQRRRGAEKNRDGVTEPGAEKGNKEETAATAGPDSDPHGPSQAVTDGTRQGRSRPKSSGVPASPCCPAPGHPRTQGLSVCWVNSVASGTLKEKAGCARRCDGTPKGPRASPGVLVSWEGARALHRGATTASPQPTWGPCLVLRPGARWPLVLPVPSHVSQPPVPGASFKVAACHHTQQHQALQSVSRIKAAAQTKEPVACGCRFWVTRSLRRGQDCDVEVETSVHLTLQQGPAPRQNTF